MSSTLERLAPLSGVAAVVLFLVGFVAVMNPPGFMPPVEEITAWYADDTGRVLFGAVLVSLAALLLLWFAGSVRSVLQGAEPAGGRLPAIALGGGAAAAALLLASTALHFAGALRADEDGSIAPESAQVLYDGALLLQGVAMPYALAAMLFAAAAAILRTGARPRYLGWAALAIAVPLLVAPIAFFALGAFALWAIAMAVDVYRSPPAAAPAP